MSSPLKYSRDFNFVMNSWIMLMFLYFLIFSAEKNGFSSTNRLLNYGHWLSFAKNAENSSKLSKSIIFAPRSSDLMFGV